MSPQLGLNNILNINIQLFTVKVVLCTDNMANLRVKSVFIASQFNAVYVAKSCLKGICYTELRLFNHKYVAKAVEVNNNQLVFAGFNQCKNVTYQA